MVDINSFLGRGAEKSSRAEWKFGAINCNGGRRSWLGSCFWSCLKLVFSIEFNGYPPPRYLLDWFFVPRDCTGHGHRIVGWPSISSREIRIQCVHDSVPNGISPQSPFYKPILPRFPFSSNWLKYPCFRYSQDISKATLNTFTILKGNGNF